MKRSVAERFASIAEIGQFYFLTVDHGRMKYSISKPSELEGNIFGTLASRAATEDVSIFAIEGPCFEVTIDKDAGLARLECVSAEAQYAASRHASSICRSFFTRLWGPDATG